MSMQPSATVITCSSCRAPLPKSLFSRNQLSAQGKRRCKACAEGVRPTPAVAPAPPVVAPTAATATVVSSMPPPPPTTSAISSSTSISTPAAQQLFHVPTLREHMTLFICSGCTKEMPLDRFTKEQLAEPEENRKCRTCISMTMNQTSTGSSNKQNEEIINNNKNPRRGSNNRNTFSREFSTTSTASFSQPSTAATPRPSNRGYCPLCEKKFCFAAQVTGLLGKPDSSVEAVSYRVVSKRNLEDEAGYFFVCEDHDVAELPVPWGQGKSSRRNGAANRSTARKKGVSWNAMRSHPSSPNGNAATAGGIHHSPFAVAMDHLHTMSSSATSPVPGSSPMMGASTTSFGSYDHASASFCSVPSHYESIPVVPPYGIGNSPQQSSVTPPAVDHGFAC